MDENQPRARKYGGLRESASITNEEDKSKAKETPQSRSQSYGQNNLPVPDKSASVRKYGAPRETVVDEEKSAAAPVKTAAQDPNAPKRLYGSVRGDVMDNAVEEDTNKEEEPIAEEENVQGPSALDYFAKAKKDAADPKSTIKPFKLKKKLSSDETMIGHLTFRRKAWTFFVSIMTCWIPERCIKCRIENPEKRQAWREKVTLCLLMLMFSIGGILWLEIKRFISCVDGDPKLNIRNPIHRNVYTTIGKNQVLIHGQLYDTSSSLNFLAQFNGIDVSTLFPRTFRGRYDADLDSCLNTAIVARDTNYNIYTNEYINRLKYNLTYDRNLDVYTNCVNPNGEFGTCYYGEDIDDKLQQNLQGTMLIDPLDLKNSTKQWFIVGDTVYDATEYVVTVTDFAPDNPLVKAPVSPLAVTQRRFMMYDDITVFIMNNFYTDATANFVALPNSNSVMKCFDKLFVMGYIQPNNRFACWVLDIPFYSMSVLVLWILYFRLITALLWYIITPRGYRKDAYVICFIPCYTEGPSMAITLETLCTADYQDEKKLLMVVCDGNITGKGNSKTTPEVALDLLGWKGVDPKPRAYLALGKADMKVNMAKVYSGFYEFKGHTVPYMVIAKVGKPSEHSQSKPGNRGKRDSQLILMNFYNKLTYKGRKMFPLEYEMYFHIKNIIKVDPLEYEYCLMVDADTKVDEGSLKHLIGPLIENPMVIAGCGETQVSNKYASYTSMIQIYEYWINHHYGKCFESFFGKVTCLPGCFCIYRMRYPRGEPFLCSDAIIKDYSINRTMTLHTKNLLHLGEDRYLTTLILKHFPTKRLIFLPMAICSTDIPDKFAVLKSQRRRWINSTFHNQYVLFNIPKICGRWCCDMKLLIMYELSSFLVMPAATLYLYSLVVRGLLEGGDYTITLAGLAVLYGVHMVIIFVQKRPSYLIWLFIYTICSYPIHGLYLPVYSFWHFDDFRYLLFI